MAKTTVSSFGKCAIYARFSSDKQSDTSIDDQVRRAHEMIAREGSTSIEVFSDYAISGKDMNRPGVRALETAIRAGKVDTVVAESQDRISRDVESSARFLKLCKKHKVTIAYVGGSRIAHDDRGAPLNYHLQSMMAENFRSELSYKTKRGKEGKALKGLSNGGLPYGYSSDAEGRIVIDQEESKIVRRIFAEAIAGRTMTRIAHGLNADDAPTPRKGKPWTTSTVQVLLKCQKYAGQWSFSNVVPLSFRKDLVIIDPAQFAQVAAAFEARKGRAFSQARQAHLLSGIMHCAVCGSRMVSAGGFQEKRYFACSVARLQGRCSNTQKIILSVLQDKLIAAMKTTLEASRDVIATVAAEELEAWKAKRRPSERTRIANELRAAEKKLENLIDALASLGNSPAIVARIKAAEERVADLKAQLAKSEGEAPKVPTVSELVSRVVNLEALVNHGDVDVARQQLSRLLKSQKVIAKPTPNGFQISCDLIFDSREYALANSHVSPIGIPVSFCVATKVRKAMAKRAAKARQRPRA